MNLSRWLCLLILFVIPCATAKAWATFTIRVQTAIGITLTGFDALNDFSLFQGRSPKKTPSDNAWACVIPPMR